MNLATRCPACGTVFRVVRDQLKVSEGWVRCGRCSEVFNAGERLFELEPAGAPPVASPPPAPPAPAVADLPAVARMGAALAPPSPVPPQPKAPVAEPSQQAPAQAAEAEASDEAPAAAEAETPAPQRAPDDPWAEPAPAQAAVDDAPPGDAPSTETPPEPLAQDAAAAAPTETGTDAAGAAATAGDATADPALDAALSPTQTPAADLDLRADPAAVQSQPMPGFVLRAEREARWRHPLLRAGLALLCLLLTATLAGQMALHYRDDVAARWPRTKPWLQGACQWLGCRVEPPRHIDSVAVDSSGLVRVEGSDLYRLTLVVQNRSTLPVRMPAIELALTDAQGRTMARRVLSAADLGQAVDSLPPQGEVALQAMLELGERRVAGYTVELFYP